MPLQSLTLLDQVIPNCGFPQNNLSLIGYNHQKSIPVFTLGFLCLLLFVISRSTFYCVQTNRRDIETQEDINYFVDEFYRAVKTDDLIGPIFNEIIQNQWPKHLDKMYRFWGSILLGSGQYHGRPFPPHRSLPLEKRHFDRWLFLFQHTLNSCFSGDKTNEATKRAELMAQLFLSKIEHLRSHHSII